MLTERAKNFDVTILVKERDLFQSFPVAIYSFESDRDLYLQMPDDDRG